MFTRREAVRVSLAYRYHNRNWDRAKNEAIYGADHNEVGLGANMTIWLAAEGPLGPDKLVVGENFFAAELAKAKSLLDHRCLFEVEPWFHERVATLENIALFLSEKLGRQTLTLEENAHWSVDLNEGAAMLKYAFLFEASQIIIAVRRPIDLESGLIASRSEILSAVKRWESTLNLHDVRRRRNQESAKPLFIFNSLREELPDLAWIRLEGRQTWAYELRT
jgi:hypothetical protein